ncbi:MAG: hypothetical protein ACPH97_04445, partial [Flavobacteriales bacterium]
SNTAVNQSPPFKNAPQADFALNGNASIWNGVSSIPPFTAFEVSKDLAGESRNSTAPTKGCYERVP